jgi:hypothetical protein
MPDCPLAYLPIYLPAYTKCLSAHLPQHESVCPVVYLSANLAVCTFDHLSVCLYHLLVCISAWTCICLPIRLAPVRPNYLSARVSIS